MTRHTALGDWRTAVLLAPTTDWPGRQPPVAPSSHAMRVAVIGAGVAGSFCAHTIRRLHPAATVDVFEGGFSPGGRVGSRRSRCSGLEQLRIPHGTPAFTATTKEFREALAPLVDGGVVADFSHASLGALRWDTTQRNAEAIPYTEPLQLYRDVEGRLCRELLSHASHVHLGCKVEAVEWSGDTATWTLRTSGSEALPGYDRIAVSSATAGHERWRAMHGTAPPLEALRGLPGASLHAMLEGLAAVETRPVYSVMAAYEATDAVVKALRGLNFDLAHVEGHPVIRKIVRGLPDERGASGGGRPGQGGFATLVVHTSSTWAESRPSVSARRSSAAAYVASGSADKAAEAAYTAEIWDSAKELLRGHIPGLAALQPVYGPQLHRWGSAFPRGPPYDGATFAADYGFAVCGDFVGDASTIGNVEAAAISGIRAGQALASSGPLPSGNTE